MNASPRPCRRDTLGDQSDDIASEAAREKTQSLLDSHLANGAAVPTSQLKRELDAVETEYRKRLQAAQNRPAVKMSR